MPVTRGIRTSVTITSNGSRESRSRASRPSAASATWQPRRRNQAEKISRMSGSSSAIRMREFFQENGGAVGMNVANLFKVEATRSPREDEYNAAKLAKLII